MKNEDRRGKSQGRELVDEFLVVQIDVDGAARAHVPPAHIILVQDVMDEHMGVRDKPSRIRSRASADRSA